MVTNILKTYSFHIAACKRVRLYFIAKLRLHMRMLQYKIVYFSTVWNSNQWIFHPENKQVRLQAGIDKEQELDWPPSLEVTLGQ